MDAIIIERPIGAAWIHTSAWAQDAGLRLSKPIVFQVSHAYMGTCYHGHIGRRPLPLQAHRLPGIPCIHAHMRTCAHGWHVHTFDSPRPSSCGHRLCLRHLTCIHAYVLHAHAHTHTCTHTHTHMHTHTHAHIHVQAGSVVYPEAGARRTLLIGGHTSYVEAVNAQIMGLVNTAEGIALEER